MGFKGNTIVINGSELILFVCDIAIAIATHVNYFFKAHAKAHNLEPAAIAKGRPSPVHKGVDATGLINHIMPWAQIKMVGVHQAGLGASGC